MSNRRISIILFKFVQIRSGGSTAFRFAAFAYVCAGIFQIDPKNNGFRKALIIKMIYHIFGTVIFLFKKKCRQIFVYGIIFREFTQRISIVPCYLSEYDAVSFN